MNGWKHTELGCLPAGEDIGASLDYGTSVKCERENGGVPVLRIPNIIGGRIDLNDLKHGHPKAIEVEALRLQFGDLLFVRTNGVLENTGRCALFRGELEPCYFASYLIRVQVNESTLLPDFLNEYARTELGRSFLSGRAIRTAVGATKNCGRVVVGAAGYGAAKAAARADRRIENGASPPTLHPRALPRTPKTIRGRPHPAGVGSFVAW
jgi:hypothetical protein